MSCLQQLEALEANNWTQNNVHNKSPVASKSSPDGTQHSERHNHGDDEHSVARGAHCVSYVLLHKDALY